MLLLSRESDQEKYYVVCLGGTEQETTVWYGERWACWGQACSILSSLQGCLQRAWQLQLSRLGLSTLAWLLAVHEPTIVPPAIPFPTFP